MGGPAGCLAQAAGSPDDGCRLAAESAQVSTGQSVAPDETTGERGSPRALSLPLCGGLSPVVKEDSHDRDHDKTRNERSSVV
jgi:hypothetical protein